MQEVEATMSHAQSERCFEDWVRRRLSAWTSGEIQAFDRWLRDESLHEFVPAVRAALGDRYLEESA